MEMMEIIKTRKSVRTFDGRKIPKEKLEKLCSYIKTIKNPYYIPVELYCLTRKNIIFQVLSLKEKICILLQKYLKSNTVKKHSDTHLKRWCYMHDLWEWEPPGLEEH